MAGGGTIDRELRHIFSMAPSPALGNSNLENARLAALRGNPASAILPATGAEDLLRPVRGVLIVDDDDAMRSLVGLASQELGYDVFKATNGVEALEILGKHRGRIGLVLTDVNMPVMDGLELVRSLNSQPLSPPVAVMSGSFEPQICSALKAEGITKLLGKPFTLAELHTVLLQMLDLTD